MFMEFSTLIKKIRLQGFLTQDEFAKIIGVSFATVNRWEMGRTIPAIKTMKKIDGYCKTIGIDCDLLGFLFMSNKQNPKQ